MELKAVIQNRVSVRNFKDEPVPEADIREMVRLAGLAPSINNYQPWSFIGITGRDKLNLIADIVAGKMDTFPVKSSKFSKNIKSQVEYFSTFFRDAPAVIAVILEEYETVWEKGIDIGTEEINRIRNYPDIQCTGACIQNILLAAVDMGYGACWMSGPMVAKEEIQNLLDINPPSQLISFVAVGNPLGEPKPKVKEDLSERMKFITD